MLLCDIGTAQEVCALIEGPGFGDADFYGNWLLAVAKAETLEDHSARRSVPWADLGCHP